MSKTRFVAVVDGEPGAYGVWVPDMPGANAMGDTVEEALKNTQSVMLAWVEDAMSDKEELPAPRGFGEVARDPEVVEALNQGAVLAIVPLLMEEGRSVRANISMDAWLLAAIDEAAKARGLTRSAFLSSAAREKIAKE